MKNPFKSSKFLALSLFCTFLKRNHVYHSFMRNFLKSLSGSDIKDLEKFDPEDYVGVAFAWPLTPEGANYWSFLDDKWRFIVKLFKL